MGHDNADNARNVGLKRVKRKTGYPKIMKLIGMMKLINILHIKI